MALSPAEKRWLRKMVREEVTTALADLPTPVDRVGGYDGAVPYNDDDHADESHRRIGFHVPTGTPSK
jgi:hypothetical protein